MIHIKVFDRAGRTDGRPTFDYEVKSSGVYSDGELQNIFMRLGEITNGPFQGRPIQERIQGRLKLSEAPYDADIKSYSLFFYSSAELYRELYDDQIHIQSYSNISQLKIRADRYAEQGIDFLGNKFANRYEGKSGNDILNGLGGNDILFGSDGDDKLIGGRGDDYLYGGVGDDFFILRGSQQAGGGVDLVVESVAEGTDVVQSSFSYKLPAHVENLRLAGIDPDGALTGTGNGLANAIVGDAGDNRMAGLIGADHLLGRAGDDVLFGGQGADRLFGGGHADALSGGDGSDAMTGGYGADVFIFSSAAAAGQGLTSDSILGFRVGVDLIDLRRIDAGDGSPGNQAFTFIGAQSFSGAEGELRYASGQIAADTDGDALADFEIRIANLADLAEQSFQL